MREKISACVTAGNEEENIARCLQSLTWCDEIIVVDSYSKDRTVEISRRFTDRVVQHEWLGYIGQKNLIRGMARFNWVLFLDADEEISPALRDEIIAEFEHGPGAFVGYKFPRMVYYLGQWIRHGEWYPDVKLRLFRKDRGHSAGREPHDHVLVDGPVRRLHHPIHHYTYSNITEHIETMNRFTSITAQAQIKEGQRFRLTDWMIRPYWRFLKAYVLKGGCLDGKRGLLIAAISAYAVLIKYAKLWEQELLLAGRCAPPPIPPPPQAKP